MPTNLEIVQKSYAHFSDGDIEGILNLWEQPAIWQSGTGLTPEILPIYGRREGLIALKEYFDLLAETLEFETFEVRNWKATDDTVFAIGHYDCINKNTKKKFGSDFVHVIRLADGKIFSFKEFADTAAMKEAARV